MNEAEKKRLEARLASLDRHERQKLYKRASQMRKLLPTPTHRSFAPRHCDDDDDGPVRARVRPLSRSLDDLVLTLLEAEETAEGSCAEPVSAGLSGTVVQIGTGHCWIRGTNGDFEADLAEELRKVQQTALAVGDEVRYGMRPGSRPRVEVVLPRRTFLARSDPSIAERQRVIVANVDKVVVVVSVVVPPLHPRLIDRYLIAIAKGGASPVIAVNKLDLLTDPSELAVLDPYRALDVPIVYVSAEGRTGLDELKAELGTGVCAFVGHSGVGKSSILNALRPDLNLKVVAAKRRGGKGKHTTTASTLWDVSDGLQIIDTPGIRSFGLWRLTPEEVLDHFPDFAGIECRYRDCSHRAEPGCGVRLAVDSGRIAPSRYDTFLRLSASLD